MAPLPIDQLGVQLLELFPGLRVHNASVHDGAGELIWLSEGALGPDEHRVVLDALDSFALEGRRLCLERPLGEGHTAIVFAIRDPRGQRRGAVLVVAESRSVDGSGNERALNPALQSLLRRIAIHLAGAAGSETSTMSMTSPRPTLTSTGESRQLSLYVQQLLKLRTSGRTRRYEVLLRSRNAGQDGEQAPTDLLLMADEPGSGGALDRQVITQLMTWLMQNRERLDAEPANFSVNLSTGGLLDTQLPGFIGQTLRDAQIDAHTIAFEIRERLCRDHPAATERFIKACEQIGCQVVIDDFTLHSDVLPLLRSKAVRLVKIDAALTSDALKDKLAQALVVAISQAAKVLGTHCVAKRIDSAMARQWLSAVGVDFAQGFLLEGPLPLTDLATLQDQNARGAG